MSRSARALPVLLTVATFASFAQAAVIVTFQQPEKYSDTGRFRGDAPEVLKEIERHLQQLGKRYLPEDRTLRIDVLDVDLAGEERFPRRDASEVRVLKGRADWPRIHLRYALEEGGKVRESREETLDDMNYLQHPITTRQENLAYEKRMLDTWFRARFAGSFQAPARIYTDRPPKDSQ
jgi:hypothetical protein